MRLYDNGDSKTSKPWMIARIAYSDQSTSTQLIFRHKDRQGTSASKSPCAFGDLKMMWNGENEAKRQNQNMRTNGERGEARCG